MSSSLTGGWSSVSMSTGTEETVISTPAELADAYQRRLKLKQSLDGLVNEGSGISAKIDIPRVVVIGSQSSGKSSLFEGISGISLPRDTGTCTRCPIICQMVQARGTRWRCRIYLVREMGTEGLEEGSSKRIQFGEDINERDAVCDRIQRAQAAILHPDIDPKNFLGSYRKAKESGFSSDSILVEISGPDVIDLSFVDLPGIIAMDNDDSENVGRVERLVSSYVENLSSLVLLVYKCSDDLLNQGAGRIAKLYDPNAERTITVLTKPDLIEDGQEAEWQKMIRISHTCFCVRLPGPSQVSTMSQEQARLQEMEFFREDEAWVDLASDPDVQQRLGIQSLTNYLNVRLLEWIVERLPQTQADIQRYLRDIDADLAQLPAQIDDPVRLANQILWRFGRKMSAAVDIHNFRVPDLVGTCRRRLEEFVDLLFYHLYPRFWPLEQKEKLAPKATDFGAFPPILPKIKTFVFQPPHNVFPPPAVYIDEVVKRADIGRTRELPGNHPYGVLKDYMEKSVDVWEVPTVVMVDDIIHHIVTALKAIVQEHFGSFKPGLRIWEEVKIHIETRGELARRALLKLISRERAASLVFGRSEYFHYKEAYLKHYTLLRRSGGEDYGESDNDDKGMTEALKTVGRSACAVGVAMGEPGIVAIGMTVGAVADGVEAGDDAIKRGEDIPTAICEGVSAGATSMAEGIKATKGTSPVLRRYSISETPAKHRRTRPIEISEVEGHGISIMAQTRAFYHVAVRRYAEGAAQVVFHDLLLDLECGPELEQKLREVIGLSGPDPVERCRKFVEPSQDMVRRRQDLVRKQAVFTDVLRELESFI